MAGFAGLILGSVVASSIDRGQARGNHNRGAEPVAEEKSNVRGDRKETPRWTRNIAAWNAQEDREPADNSFCYVCHANYDGEKLSRVHQPVGVGCETCHGISDKHSEDEDGLVPPDILFPRSQIMTFCVECHTKQELLETDDHKQLFEDQSEDRAEDQHREASGRVAPGEVASGRSTNGTTEAQEHTCTDCHGRKHHLKVRTRRWNKKTGKLEWYDGVRMMQERKADKK